MPTGVEGPRMAGRTSAGAPPGHRDSAPDRWGTTPFTRLMGAPMAGRDVRRGNGQGLAAEVSRPAAEPGRSARRQSPARPSSTFSSTPSASGTRIAAE
ncbi:hypothetical protein KIPE111705_06685 [Kibdelosporangium persicum]